MTEEIVGGYEITGTYRCKNRLLKTDIRLTTVQFNKTCKFKKGYFLTCDTHGNHKDDNINQTDALFYMRKPWLWCDECAALHFNTVWQISLDVRRGNHTHRCNCFLEEDDNE
jgi:hypothetical protein